MREDADVSGKELAERLGWAGSKVSRLETGKQTATAGDVRAWAAALGVPASAVAAVSIAVLPWEAELPIPLNHGFNIFDDRLVLVETIDAELAIREPEDIALYARLFELYWGAALHGDEAAALIARIARELPGS